MSSVIKAVASALTLVLALTALAAVRPDVALGDEGHAASDPQSTPTTVAGEEAPPAEEAPATTTAPTEAPPATEAAPAPEAPPAAEAPTTTAPTTTTTVAPRTYPRLPSLRVGSKPHCRRGINACYMARHHQRNGNYLWRNGRVFETASGELVRGTRAYTWTRMQREARQLVRYLRAVDRAKRAQKARRALVSRWSGVARCESGGRWSIATGNGYYGGLQFSLRTWRAYGGRGYPHQQPAWYQAKIADNLRRSSGLHHWPHCGRHYG